MRLILGGKAYHLTDSYLDSPFIKKLLCKAVDKIRKRVDEIITMDENLREMLFRELNCLERNVKSINKISKAPLIANFLEIIGRLLGYDWMDGRTYRTPVYFRTKDEELADYKMQKGQSYKEGCDEENNLILERYKIAKDLKAKGLTRNQIARILKITVYAVNQMLKDEVLAKVQELHKKGLGDRQIDEELKKLGCGYYHSQHRYRHTL
ncbi:MAG TPA: hypothetical protein VJZ02_00580 [Candidatus Brocadiales bacterium]|nr:hypothetical protein [Candidatus Brocadiales bacterium]